jgi:subtilisin family serine protease
MRQHTSFADASGNSRVKRNVDMRNARLADWLVGVDSSISPAPGSTALANYENAINAGLVADNDPYGHGTHVASIAAGRGFYQTPDSTGIAPNANIYDVRVLGADGTGNLSDVLEGIQWAIFHAKEFNIRVLNLSLAADSTDSWLIDPLCQAVRRAAAAGITVVVAGGNFGLNTLKKEVFGAIGSPGHDPSVITVGSVNWRDTLMRGDDVVNNFSSRGPTRGDRLVNGVRKVDNLIKPDLVAPGNRILGAASTNQGGTVRAWNRLATGTPTLKATADTTAYGRTLMALSGTSIAAPAVAGTVALMLQANPGLTPPLIKAILQYSAQPLPGASLLHQGAGMLNIEGAVTLARALRTDIGPAINAGTLATGQSLLASGKTMPAATSTINGQRSTGRAWCSSAAAISTPAARCSPSTR